MIKRILVGLCGTPYAPFVISRAVELARLYGADLTGVTVVDVGRLSRIGPVPLVASRRVDQLVNSALLFDDVESRSDSE